MANTTNLDLVKPLGTDHALVSVINGNMDKIDAFAGGVNSTDESMQSSIAIVSDGDTHAAIAAGQFVYIKNHNTLNEGLYTANSAIAANVALTSSNVTAVSGGGLNALNSKIGIQTHGKGSVAWGGSVDISRPEYASMLVFGGRGGSSFMFYVPANTNERSVITLDALTDTNITSTKVTITAAASGTGTTLSYEYLAFA